MKFTYNKKDEKIRNNIYEFCRLRYYFIDEDGCLNKCQFYEDCSDEYIDEMIESDFEALREFIERNF